MKKLKFKDMKLLTKVIQLGSGRVCILIQAYGIEVCAFNFYKMLSQEYSIHSLIKQVRDQIVNESVLKGIKRFWFPQVQIQANMLPFR